MYPFSEKLVIIFFTRLSACACNVRKLMTTIVELLLLKSFLLYMISPHLVKYIYFEKVTKFCKIYTLLLSYVVPVKSKVEISQNFLAFSEYMYFNKYLYAYIICLFSCVFVGIFPFPLDSSTVDWHRWVITFLTST